MPGDRDALVELLAADVPALASALAEHRVVFGEAAPEVFLRTLAAMTAGRAQASTATDRLGRQPLERAAGFLESVWSDGADTDDLIRGSYLTPLVHFAQVVSPNEARTDHADDVRALLGPRLRGEYERLSAAGAASPVAQLAFIDELVRAVPDLRPVWRAHVEDWDEVLTHIFLADVRRTAQRWFDSQREDDRAALAALLDHLDESVDTDPQVRELVATGFVEDLPYPGEPGDGIVDLLGPKLRAEYARQRRG